MAGSSVFFLNRVAGHCFPDRTIGALKLRMRMIAAGLKHKAHIAAFQDIDPASSLGQVMATRPEVLGTLVWPYQCAGWDAATRLDRMLAHYREVDRIGAPFIFGALEKLQVADLSDVSDDLRLVIDQPRWFMREGGLVVNMFVGDFRAFSLAFSLFRDENDALCATIGGVQGRNVDSALDLYRGLTKALHGLRPRDFMIEVFRMLCRHLGVQHIYAVSQKHRHHQHPYFGEKDLSPDYDAIWDDREGTAVNDQFYTLDVNPPARDFATIKPNKRSLYRKRFAFLDDLEARLAQGVPNATPITFVDT